MDINIEIPDRFTSFISDWDYETQLLLGGYGSGKSYSIGLKIVFKLLEERRTALVVRNILATMKESCFMLFKDILTKLDMLSDGGKDGKIQAIVSPMEIRFPNGSRIIFKGLDNPEKVKSLHGVSIVWIEECSEIRYDAYKELIGRIRENKVSLHFILSCNPVGKENWVYNYFFKRTNDDGSETVICDEEQFYKRRTMVCKLDENQEVYYHHSLPDDNPFLPKAYLHRLDGLKKTDKQLWVVARWGRFGANGTRVLPNFVVAKDPRKFKNKVNSISAHFHFFGLDFGFEESFNALISCCVDDANKILYIYDEIYVNHITDDRFAEREDVRGIATKAGRCEKPICADSAEPKTIKFYRQQGYNMKACKKYAGSRLQNTKKIKRFRKIVCSPRCKNTIKELSGLTYKKDSKGNVIYDEFNIDPHTFNKALGVYKLLEKLESLKSVTRAEVIFAYKKHITRATHRS